MELLKDSYLDNVLELTKVAWLLFRTSYIKEHIASQLFSLFVDRDTLTYLAMDLSVGINLPLLVSLTFSPSAA